MEKYGLAPYRVALIHGGPGAAGEMASVARGLEASFGILEPHQTGLSIEDQITELRYDLLSAAQIPVVLVGYSWGAWLACIFAARFPELISKLILVSSGSFEESYASGIDEMRMSRLSSIEQIEISECTKRMSDNTESPERKLQAFGRIGELFGKADSFDPIEKSSDEISLSPEIFSSVWPEAAVLRASGELMNIVRSIACPVLAIHGSHDSHSADGVRVPLSSALKDFRFELLENCGHSPWKERLARDRFFMILRSEIYSAFK